MPTTFEKCPDDVTDLAGKVLRESFPELARAGLTFGCLFAKNQDTHPLKIAGHPVTDKVRIVSLKDRAAGFPDVQIYIDETWWNGCDDDAPPMMFWRAFRHLKLTAPSDRDIKLGNVVGGYKADDLGRPKLKFVHCDFMTSGFWSSVELFGEKAPEVAELKVIGQKVRELVQREFWG